MSNQTHKLALGTVQFGLPYGIGNNIGQTSREEAREILDFAWLRGIETLDTASLYGESEAVLGEYGVINFQVISKFPNLEKTHELEAILQQSLDRLKLPSLYAYMAHRSETLLESPEIWTKLQMLKKRGKILKAGYSLYTVEELDRLLYMNMYPDIIQVPFSVIDRRFEDRIESLHATGTEIHTRSAFLQGLFFQKVQHLSPFFDILKPWLSQLTEQFPDLGIRAAALLNFCIQKPFIDRVVVGVNNRSQLEKNLDSLKSTSQIGNFPNVPAVGEEILLPSNWP